MVRREFIINGSRWFIAGGLLGTSGLLTYRSRIGNPDDCFVNPYCKRCGKNSSCSVIAEKNPDQNEKKGRK